ncbi:MAG: ribonuclease HIII [Bacilli bacterium]|jgi:ribonuclease HIII
MKHKTIVYKISANTQKEMIKYFEDKKRSKTPPYAVFQAEEADTVITLYQSGKVMFQGLSADIDAAMWKEKEEFLNKGKKVIDLTKKKKEKVIMDKSDYYYLNSIGSDEVGTGDYFGPIVVTSAYVSKKDINYLEEIGVQDSKKITDENIKEIAPFLIKRIKHSSIILNNQEYNETHNKKTNLNKIKALLHNKVLLSLINNNNLNYEKIIMDQFVHEKKYYEYLKEIPTKISNITFITNAEDKNLSVACASIISRFIFLKELDKLNKKFNLNLPKGAGSKVDSIGKEIVNKYGKEILKEIAKLNFKNTDKILLKENL